MKKSRSKVRNKKKATVTQKLLTSKPDTLSNNLAEFLITLRDEIKRLDPAGGDRFKQVQPALGKHTQEILQRLKIDSEKSLDDAVMTLGLTMALEDSLKASRSNGPIPLT